MKTIYAKLISFGLIATSCTSILEPIDENRIDEDYLVSHPENAEGLLLSSYATAISQSCWGGGNSSYNLSVASDEAVSNKNSNGFRRMVNGELAPTYNPLGTERWNNNYEAVFYANKFLSLIDKVNWYEKESVNELFKRRLSGEALALRAYHHHQVLECFAGEGADGVLYGVPYFDVFLDNPDDFREYQRLDFTTMVSKVMEDYEEAWSSLPYEYSNDESLTPEGYNPQDWTLVNGSKYDLRINGEIVRALQARLMLMAGSKAFEVSPSLTEEYNRKAAGYAAGILSGINFQLAPDGQVFYDNDADMNNEEILWRTSRPEPASNAEKNNFLPSLNGTGGVNPSQNFVDAFPMKDGYPRNESPNYTYTDDAPYKDRDPRLDKMVIRNGSVFGGVTFDANDAKDGINMVSEQSTRTGYYLKKLLRPDVVIPAAGNPTNQVHINVMIRYTEIFLILAEAQNNLGGPDYKIEGSSMSARDILRSIRKRAMALASDPYLDAVSSGPEMMALIQNERRLELSFEGFRFWDMRRWGLPLDEDIYGFNIGKAGSEKRFVVETRNMGDDKYRWLPLLRNEIRKYKYVQNKGW